MATRRPVPGVLLASPLLLLLLLFAAAAAVAAAAEAAEKGAPKVTDKARGALPSRWRSPRGPANDARRACR